MLSAESPVAGRSTSPAGRWPVVVFGTGGSGTRAVAAFLSACGIDMGERVNNSGDALEFSPVLEEHIDAVLQVTRRLDYEAADIDAGLLAKIVADYRRAAEQHRGGAERWGFKNPRHLFLLPLIAEAFPDATFIHVVRDGRDMLLSRNRNQPKKHFEALFDQPFGSNEADIARFWAKTNLEARAFGMRLPPHRYIVARIEDLYGLAQSEVIGRLAEALDIPMEVAARASSEFEAQDTFGRGRDYQLGGTGQAQFVEALRELGYA